LFNDLEDLPEDIAALFKAGGGGCWTLDASASEDLSFFELVLVLPDFELPTFTELAVIPFLGGPFPTGGADILIKFPIYPL
jgi:hypothetical protein